ncbi:MAG: hypothetical protein WED81_07020, partial [Rhodothermales bacterium]
MPKSFAQLYGVRHRPTDVEYLHFDTPHFRLIYQTGLHAEALEMSSILERSLPEVRALVGLRRELHVPVVLNSFSDRSNGYVASLPFRQEIESTNLRVNILSPRYESWFEVVAPHELVHAAHAESGRGFGLGWILRKIGPDLARTLNLSGPRGISEGAAVYYESSFRPGAGRLNHSLFTMEFRAAMLSRRPLSLAQMLEPPSYTRPFDRYYHGGAHLFAFMADQNKLDFFPRAREFFYRFPLLGYGPALWYGTGVFPRTLGRRLRRHYYEMGREFVESLGELTDVRVIASERGASYRRPRWIDDETLLVHARGYDWRTGFYRVHVPTGERELVANQGITEDSFYSLSPDRKSVLFSRYVPDMFEPIRSRAEAFRLNLSTGNVSRLTRHGRVHAPVEASDGTIWVLKNEPQFNLLSTLTSTGEVVSRQVFERTYFLAAEPSPSGDTLAILANRSGHQGIFRLNTGGDDLEPWIVFPNASIYDMSWSDDGRYLLFTADPGRVSNVFALDAVEDRIYKLTNVPFGALEPGLSPDGTTLAFVNYRHERFELVQIPFSPENATEISREQVEFEPVVEPYASTMPATAVQRKYVPLLNVR